MFFHRLKIIHGAVIPHDQFPVRGGLSKHRVHGSGQQMCPIISGEDDGNERFVDHGSATMWNMEFVMKAERDSFKPGFRHSST